MNDDRIKILRMLEEGKINVEDAARLIKAVEAEGPLAVTAALTNEPIVATIPVTTVPVKAVPITTVPITPRRTTGLGRSFLSAIASSLDGVISDGAQTSQLRVLFCSLDHTNFTDVNLEGCWVVASSVADANFTGANLRGARIFCSDLGNADFRGANLAGTTIICSSLGGGDFRGVDLSGQTLIATNLPGINARNRVVDLATEE